MKNVVVRHKSVIVHRYLVSLVKVTPTSEQESIKFVVFKKFVQKQMSNWLKNGVES